LLAVTLGVAVLVLSVACYFAAWEITGNWKHRARYGLLLTIWIGGNVAAPFFALSWICFINRRSVILSCGIPLVLLIMGGFFTLVHWPGQYQMIRGGPTGQPNGTYVFAVVWLCLVQWGVVLLLAIASLGHRVVRALRR
jgi:hypothetical protein